MIALLTATLTSCSSILYRAPEVRLADAELGEISVFSTEVIVTVRLRNPNNYSMHITGARYNLLPNGLDIGQGSTHQPRDILPFETSLQRVTFHIDNLAMLGNIQKMIETQIFHYQISGDVFLGDGIFSDSLHVSQEGSVSGPGY